MSTFHLHARSSIPIGYEPFALEIHSIVNWTEMNLGPLVSGQSQSMKAKYKVQLTGSNAQSAWVVEQCMQCQFRCY